MAGHKMTLGPTWRIETAMNEQLHIELQRIKDRLQTLKVRL